MFVNLIDETTVRNDRLQVGVQLDALSVFPEKLPELKSLESLRSRKQHDVLLLHRITRVPKAQQNDCVDEVNRDERASLFELGKCLAHLEQGFQVVTGLLQLFFVLIWNGQSGGIFLQSAKRTFEFRLSHLGQEKHFVVERTRKRVSVFHCALTDSLKPADFFLQKRINRDMAGLLLKVELGSEFDDEFGSDEGLLNVVEEGVNMAL